MTVGLHNPHTRTMVKPGSYVTVDPEDTVFGPLIGIYLIPADRKGRDLPPDRWPGAEASDVEAPAPTAPELEDASKRPQEPFSAPPTPDPGVSLPAPE